MGEMRSSKNPRERDDRGKGKPPRPRVAEVEATQDCNTVPIIYEDIVLSEDEVKRIEETVDDIANHRQQIMLLPSGVRYAKPTKPWATASRIIACIVISLLMVGMFATIVNLRSRLYATDAIVTEQRDIIAKQSEMIQQMKSVIDEATSRMRKAREGRE